MKNEKYNKSKCIKCMAEYKFLVDDNGTFGSK